MQIAFIIIKTSLTLSKWKRIFWSLMSNKFFNCVMCECVITHIFISKYKIQLANHYFLVIIQLAKCFQKIKIKTYIIVFSFLLYHLFIERKQTKSWTLEITNQVAMVLAQFYFFGEIRLLERSEPVQLTWYWFSLFLGAANMVAFDSDITEMTRIWGATSCQSCNVCFPSFCYFSL